LCVICVSYDAQQLAESLDEFGGKWELNPGDGAFYGPKVDLILLILLSLITHVSLQLMTVQYFLDISLTQYRLVAQHEAASLQRDPL